MKHGYMGHEKEPPSRSGKAGGKHPLVHSHSARPHRKIGGGKRGMKKMM